MSVNQTIITQQIIDLNHYILATFGRYNENGDFYLEKNSEYEFFKNLIINLEKTI
jgi:hypothetical protein